MSIAQHIWSLVLFLLIAAGPIPYCLLLCRASQSQSNRNSFTQGLLILLTGWMIAEVTVGLLLGMVNHLSLSWILLVETSLLISGLIVFYRRYRDRLPVLTWQKFQLNKIELALLGSILAAGITILIRTIAQPITEFDSLSFHLPAIARWYQAGSLTLLDPAGHWIFAHEDARLYPYNWHILSVLFVMPFREDFFVALPMLFAWGVLGLSIYLLSREFGSARIYSLAAASLVLTMPMLLDQVNTILVDLPLAAIFMVSLYFALSYHRTRAPVEFILFLASAGVLCGIKLFGVIYAGFAVGTLILLEAKLFLMSKDFLAQYRRILQVKLWIFVGMTIALFLGSFWYIRNFWQIKNYVADINSSLIASTQIAIAPLSGLRRLQNTTLTHQFDITNISNWKILTAQLLLRLQLPMLAILSQIILFPHFIFRRKLSREKPIFLILVVVGVGFLYWNTPYSSGTDGYDSGQISPLFGANMRYGYSCLAMLGVAASVVASSLKISKRAVLSVVLLSGFLGITGSTIFSVLRNESFREGKVVWISRLFINLILRSSSERSSALFDSFSKSNLLALIIYPSIYIAAVFIILKLWKASPHLSFISARPKTSKRISSITGFALSVGLLVVSTWSMRELRDIYRTEIYRGIYQHLDANLNSNSKIAYLLSSRSYLFYGKEFNNTVLHIPLVPDREQDWLEALRYHKVELVAAGPSDPKKTVEKEHFLQLVEQRKLISTMGDDVDNEPVLYRFEND